MARLQRMIGYLGLSTLVLVTMLFALAAPAAAYVSSVSVAVGNAAAGGNSSYNLEFSTGAPLAGGTDTITLTFLGGGDFQGVQAADVWVWLDEAAPGSVYSVTAVQQTTSTLTFRVPTEFGVIPAATHLRLGINTGVINPKAAGSYTLQVSTSMDAPVSSAPFSIVPGPFAELQVLMPGETAAPGTATGLTGSPTAQTAGTPFSVTVNAVDANWNLVTSNTDTVSFASSDGQALIPAAAPLAAGSGTFSVTLKTAGNQTVTATDGAVTETSSPAAVSGLAATSLSVTGATNVVAGSSFTLTITAKDTYGNAAGSYTGDKAITFSGLSPSPVPNNTEPTASDKNNQDLAFGVPTTVTFNSGTATTVVKPYLAATGQSVTVTVGGLSQSTVTFGVTPAPAASFAVSAQMDTQAGYGIALILFATDPYGNTNDRGINDYVGDKTLIFSGLAPAPDQTNATVLDKSNTVVTFGTPTTVTFTDGRGIGYVTPYNAGTNQQVTVTAGAIHGTSGSFDVGARGNDHFVVTGASDRVAGGSFTLTLAAHDFYRNTDTSYTGDHAIRFIGLLDSPNQTKPKASDKDNGAVNFGTPTTVSFSGGVGTSQVTAYTTGTNQTVTVIDESGSGGTSDPFNVTPTAAASLFIWGEYDITVGSNNSLQIIAKDLYGNTNSSGSHDYDGDRTLTFSGLAASPNGTKPTAVDKSSQDVDFNSATTVTFNHGVANTWIMPYNAANNQQVSVTQGALYGNTGPFAVLVGPVHHFGVTGASDQVAGGGFTLTLTAQDRGGNTNTGYTGDKAMRFSGLTESPDHTKPTAQDKGGTDVNFGTDTTVTFTGGVGTSLVKVYKTGTNQAVTVTDPAGKTGTSGTFTVTPGPAATFRLSPDTTNISAGGTIGVIVQAKDVLGNFASGYQGTIRLSSTDASFQPITYTVTSADHGYHVFTFPLNTAGNQTITATDTTHASITGTSTAITVTGSLGGGGGGYVEPVIIPEVASVSVSGPATVPAGQQADFTATSLSATGVTIPTAFTWSAADGVITASGTWTAPTKPGSYTVTARSVVGITGTAAVEVTPGPAAKVTVTAAGSSVAAGSGTSFSATVTDAYGNTLTDAQVTWSATGGTISSRGVFTADAPASSATVTATVQTAAGQVSGSATIAITGGGTGGSTDGTSSSTGGTDGTPDSTARTPVVTSDRGTIADTTQPTPAKSTVLTQPVVISGSGTVTATFHVPNAPQDSSTLAYYWDASLKQWIAVPTTFGPDGPVAQVPAGVPVALMRSGVKQPSDTRTSWANRYVLKAASLGLVSGMTDGTFHPDDPVTRYQMATVLALAAGLNVDRADLSVLSKLSDADQIPDWARPYVAASLSRGLMIGDGEGFSGDLPLTRAQIGSLLGRLLPSAPSAPMTFTDNGSIPSWARDGVARAVAAGIIKGMADGSFRPDEPLTRAQMATVMALYLDYAASHR